MNLKLWEISEEVKDLENQLSAILEDESLSEQEKDEKSQAVFEKWLNSEQNFKEKATKVANYIKHQEAVTKARKEEAQRIQTLAKQSENQANSLKKYLLNQMEKSGIHKIEGKTNKISLRQKPAQLVIKVDYEEIPQEFVQVEYKRDKNGIKRYLKEHPEVDWASLEKPNEHSLTIK